ncbi:DDE-type integrase/transposase/recombinase [Conexibacter sp. S30A1]|uniref:DDE-type integrase/transposase/recombinase n=1 Tax=Conexibacter sp. S30A1 TaxID=2937800 RepID=UPI00200F5DBF|nr:DDE-type integrase/transposase/recombinase [Conexibacter sp. S30A1]
MNEDRRREIGLFRYTLIRDAADEGLSKAERGRLVRSLAGREHVGPDGQLVRVARGTLDEWIRAYRRGGFEALLPRRRVVPVRTPAETLELAFALKRERPERTAAQVRQIMLASVKDGEDVPGLRTLQTHLARAGLNVRGDGHTAGKVYGRFEAAARNELWTGDGLHGPRLAGTAARAVLVAFIDDHSRLLTGWRWGTGEDVFRLEAALRAGLMSRGVPGQILVDRGSAFVSSQLFRACAVLGVRLIHASPRAATTKGKIERFFRTVRDQFLVEIDDGIELAELNRRFSAWVEVVYHRRVHSETKQAPLARFDAAGAPQLPTPALLREAFLWSQERTVTKTATVSLYANQYEVNAALAGCKVELVFDPFDLTMIEVRYQHRPMGTATPLVIGRRTHPQAQRELPPPPAGTGIDYLKLLAEQRDAELGGQRIDYASLTNNGDGDGDGEKDRDINQKQEG